MQEGHVENSLSTIRHAARGCLNGMKLCVSALELPCEFDEQMEFIDDVIRATDKMAGLMDELAGAFDSAGNPQPSGLER